MLLKNLTSGPYLQTTQNNFKRSNLKYLGVSGKFLEFIFISSQMKCQHEISK